jgi:uncharacterized membrane protein
MSQQPQTLSVLKFQTPYGAEQALEMLRGLQQQQLITVLLTLI